MRRAILIIFTVALGLLALPAQSVTAAGQAITVYLHGHHGNARSMAPLMQAATRQAGATRSLTAIVAGDGHVSFSGHLSSSTPRPLVQVIFVDHDTVDYHRLSTWLHNVLAGLRQRYGVHRVNLVAHSLGNTAVEWYLLKWGQAPQLPQVVKWVAIAGNFDGIPRMHMQPRHNHIRPGGRPHLLAPDFRRALLIRKRFPAVAILNLYGDLGDGSHADGRILNASSRALGFLVRGRAASYQEHRFVGPQATHRGLRFLPQVHAAVDHFLW